MGKNTGEPEGQWIRKGMNEEKKEMDKERNGGGGSGRMEGGRKRRRKEGMKRMKTEGQKKEKEEQQEETKGLDIDDVWPKWIRSGLSE